MNTSTRATRRWVWLAGCLAVGAALGGCFNADQQKVISKLNDENFTLERDIGALQGRIKDKDATIERQREMLDKGQPRVATLEAARLKELITVDGVQLRKNTGAWDFDGDGTLDGFRVFIRPTSEEGIALPATGTLTVEAFDLAQDKTQRIGKWVFTPAELKKNWYAGFGLEHFAVNCKWDAPPAHSEIVFKIVFVDTLSGSTFTDQQTIKVRLPAATQAR